MNTNLQIQNKKKKEKRPNVNYCQTKWNEYLQKEIN